MKFTAVHSFTRVFSGNKSFQFFLIFYLLFAGFSPDSFSQTPDCIKKLKGIDPVIEKILKDWNVPGCGIGIVVKDDLVFAQGYGYRDLEKKLPVTPNTLFQINILRT